MVKRLYGKDEIRIGGTTIVVKQVVFSKSDEVVRRVGSVVHEARNWLRIVLPKVRTKNLDIKFDFEDCFVDPPDEAAAISVIKSVLTTVQREISRDLSVKVRSTTSDKRADGRVAAGYVRKYHSGRRERVGGARFFEEDGKTEIHRRGDIHIDRSVVLGSYDRATRVFIHEATHRFANLRDFGDRGYFNKACTEYRKPGLTWQEALRNADSYAVFVQKLFVV